MIGLSPPAGGDASQMNYSNTLRYLQQVQGENLKLSLDNIAAIVRHLPFPADSLRYIQVAGTVGKGSTSHFLAAVLQAAGKRVGLFTSPHLLDVRERIRVNGRMISQRDFAAAVSEARRISESLHGRGIILNPPTFFEYIFLASLIHFQRCGVEWAVMEVGLGGRLDATSTLVPQAAVITTIAKDHTNILGRTITAIAGEKAGIIKAAVPVICGCLPGTKAAGVIRAAADRNRAPYHGVFDPPHHLQVESRRGGYDCRYQTADRLYSFRVKLNGRHQPDNAAVAVKTLDVLRSRGLDVGVEAVARGIPRSFIAARVEWIPGDPPILIDGGHNAAGMQVLAHYLAERGVSGATAVFGVLRDKQYKRMAETLKPFVGHVVLTRPRSWRALAPERLVPLFAGCDVQVEEDYSRALELAKKNKTLIIVTGSLYLAGEMRCIIKGGTARGPE